MSPDASSAAGQPAPDFTLRTADGRGVHARGPARADDGPRLLSVRVLPGLHLQLGIYNDLLEDFAAKGAVLYGVSCDATYSQAAFKQQLGIEIEQLSDFEPKGEACRAFGVYHPGGFPQRALVITDPDGTVRWSYEARASRRAARRQPDLRRALSDLGSAPLPPVGADDHVRGSGRLVVVYGDYECPYCAAFDAQLAALGACTMCFRHFPVRSSHPRAWPAACAAEAAARQGAFWPMHDALFADQGRLEDPHLWARAEALGLDVARFDADRRSDAVLARVKDSFRAGVRAGVATTPTAFLDGRGYPGRDILALPRLACSLNRQTDRCVLLSVDAHGRTAPRPDLVGRHRRGVACALPRLCGRALWVRSECAR